MPQLLISVRDAAEARIVLRKSPGIVDLKEPRSGSLGCADAATTAEFIAAVPAGQPCSIAMGELTDLYLDDLVGLRSQFGSQLQGFQFAKIGLAGAASVSGWRDDFARWFASLPTSTAGVAVAYLDYERCGAPEIESVVEFAGEMGCGAVLLDTHRKCHGGFDQVVEDRRLGECLQRIRDLRMLSVLAGSVSLNSLSLAVSFLPDFIGVRGAVCQGSREDEISTGRLEAFLEKFERLHGNLKEKT